MQNDVTLYALDMPNGLTYIGKPPISGGWNRLNEVVALPTLKIAQDCMGEQSYETSCIKTYNQSPKSKNEVHFSDRSWPLAVHHLSLEGKSS